MARPRRSHQTRQSLLDRGVEVLTDQGYHGTGLKEVLEALDVPKGSFYNYFESKEDFAAEVVRQYSGTVEGWLESTLDAEDALSGLKEFFRLLAAHHKDQRMGCLVGNLGAELGQGYHLIRRAMTESLGRWRRHFEKALARGQEQGTVRRDISAEVLADYLMDGLEGALLRMRIEQTTEPIRRFSSLTLSSFLSPR